MSTLKVNNIVAYSGTHVSGTFSGVFSGSFNSSRIDALEAFSSSLDNTFATDLVVNSLSGAFNSFTSALDNTYATDAQLYQLYQSTRSIELTTGSLIGITNGLMAFTAALDSTYATDAQLYQLYQATRSIELTTGSIQIQTASLLQFTASQDSRNLTLSTVTGSLIGITNGLMAFTAALDNTYATDAQLYQLYQATASLNTYTGSNDIVVQRLMQTTASLNTYSGSNDSVMSRILQTTASLNTFTGSARIELNSIEAYTASLKAAALISSSAQITALGFGAGGADITLLNNFSGSVNSYTSSNDSVRNRILQTTASLNTYTGSNDSVISRILQTTASLNTYTGSSIGIDGGLMTYTASLKSATIFSGSSQIGEIVRLQQSTASLNTITGSLIGINNGLMAYTASLKAATLISSSAQITNLGYATTGSNVFIGSQTMSGSLNIVPNQLSIGDSLEGGKVAYILQSGDTGYDPHLIKGIIVATSDQSTGIQWYNGSSTTTGATGTAIGTGLSNTDAIIASQGATSTNYAAGLARAYGGGGYSDWFLPSKDELNQLYINRVAIGGFTNNYYWSSTEATQFYSWRQNLNDGTQDTLGKSGAYYVRAVRTFSIPALTVVGNTTISGSLNVTGSVNINNLIKLTPVTSFPNGQAGMLVASASYGKTNLYVYDGSNWKWLVTGSIA